MTHPLDFLNKAPRAEAVAMIAPLVERSDWVGEATVDARPFDSDEALAEALVEKILAADASQRLEMFKVHPELAGREALEGSMTEDSQSEQGRLGLLDVAPEDMARLRQLNADYRARFGHPFIIALHRVADLPSLFATFDRRLGATPIEEHTTTLAEIASVIRARTARAYGPTVKIIEPYPFIPTETLE
ncbi:2-oxo-4-hydroxy-4-carboxy-5-ureidoimidazoline decarboxylase [Puniceibacterium sp. IMCC21224]|uniref:2-oxo-4-hydroxy-4-carboxy-5-ureidoimidazoline decarboxylase n=1 Tax=Puniceibacterium sp. IMCC21224 TaxID=1618204 RepID=UPI00065D7ED6|nr:2-oxo-4-hydroxy-4-carboxy-5-ureidoimidazoline decarboxylase [Puniceibacterium sp. IMCC21224]KMK68303.1 OHCU decarboxylase [Puniceibacterium sp. IMCC21224]